MPIAGLFEDNRPRINGLGSSFIFDASLAEDHGVEMEWTSEPTEGGETLSDNRWQRQRQLFITVIVSSALTSPIDRARHIRAWDRLRALATMEPARLFTIATSLESYDDMGLTRVGVARDPGTGESITATIRAVQIEIARVDVAENLADAAQDGGLAEQDLGNQGFAPP